MPYQGSRLLEGRECAEASSQLLARSVVRAGRVEPYEGVAQILVDVVGSLGEVLGRGKLVKRSEEPIQSLAKRLRDYHAT